MALALAQESAAQTSMDAMQIMRQQATELSGIDLPSDHSSRCRGTRALSHEQSIVSCGRTIGERHSRTSTATAHFYRASHYEELGNNERAQADFQRAIDLYSQVMLSERRSAGAVYNRGVALARMNEFDRALSDYAAATDLSPEWDVPHRSTGYVHFRRGDYSASLAAFEAAVGLDAEDDNNHAGRCEALAALGSFEAAEGACAEAVRLDEGNAYAHTANGYLKFRQAQFNEAHASFDRSVTLDGQGALAAYGRGVSAIRLGRPAEGEADIARARGQSQRAVSLYANAGVTP